MGELSSTRVQPSRPFLNTGVDYAGPISLKVGTPRSKTIIKGYIAIFVCFATKAVRIEAVTSLTTEAFLSALRRFIARRGSSIPTTALNSKVQPMNFMQSTRCFNLHLRWQQSKISSQQKDANGSSFQPTHHTSVAFGRL